MNLLEVISSVDSSLLFEIAIIIIIATVFAYLSRLIKQPLIPAYILTGIILGPIALGLIKNTETIRQLSELGIAFLLFVVGLEIKVDKLKDIGLVSSIGGLAQVIITFLVGYFVSIFLGFSSVTSMYMGLIIAFSSTMIVVKLISDKGQIDTLHGRISLGILLVQDLIIVCLLPFISKLGNFSSIGITYSLFYGIILVVLAILMSVYLFPRLFSFAARSEELLFLVSITICFLFMILASMFGFSIAIGAFIAGISLGNLHYNKEVIGRVTPLKDFFSVIFFVFLGAQLILIKNISLIESMVFFLFVIIFVKPFIVFLITILFGYDKRVSFLTGSSLGQVSEFSLILAAQGLLLNHISKEIFSLTILLTILTMIITSYTMKYDNLVYEILSKLLGIFEKLSFTTKKFEYASKKSTKSIIIFGCNRMGSIFLNTLKKNSKNILVVDHNPEIIKELMKNKISCLYGDINNTEILESIDMKNTKLIISTVPDLESNAFLIEYAKAINSKINIFVTSNKNKEALELYDYGADYVILPHLISAEILSSLIKKTIKDNKSVEKLKKEHIKYIENLKFYGR